MDRLRLGQWRYAALSVAIQAAAEQPSTEHALPSAGRLQTMPFMPREAFCGSAKLPATGPARLEMPDSAAWALDVSLTPNSPNSAWPVTCSGRSRNAASPGLCEAIVVAEISTE